MATKSATVLTLLDHAKRLDPDGKTGMTVELLSQTNNILEDMLFKEGNLPTGEQTTIRTGLPSAFYRLMNQGTPTSKSTTVQVVENTANLVARSNVDKDVAELNGDLAQFRMDEATAFVEAMSQTQAQTLLYGTAANPEEYVGFIPRYNDLSAANAQNILDAGGTQSDNMSVLLVGWGANKVFGVFPKGSKAGLSHSDLGIDDVLDSDGNAFRAYKDLWEWKNGLVVKDWRNVVRIANIDVSDLVAQTGTQALTAATSIIKLMSRAIDRIPSPEGVNLAFYVNRTLASHLRIVALEKSSAALAIEPALNQFGDKIQEMRFLGIPVRLTDQLTESEAQAV